MDLEEIRRCLRRTPWDAFPDVVICADIPVAKRHPLFDAAKAGDAKAAEALVEDVLATAGHPQLGYIEADSRPYLLAVHAVETAGMNAIPRAFARALSGMIKLPLASGIIQINRVTHTGATGYHRLAFPPVFDGKVEPSEYVLVDDFIGQGGTLANLRGYVESNNGKVIGAVTLTGKTYSGKLRLEECTLRDLREKHGRELEEWWAATFGYGLERLTESEAQYLHRSDNVDTITTRIVAARRGGD